MSDSILARADALMQRRRASPGETDDIPMLVEAFDGDDDVPLLIDAEDTPSAPDPLQETAPPSASATPDLALEGPMLDIIAHELARRVSQRLEAELPAIVESTVREFLADPDIRQLIQPRA